MCMIFHFPHRVKQCRSKIDIKCVDQTAKTDVPCQSKGPILNKSKAVTSTTQTTQMSQVCGKYNGDVSFRERKSRSSVKQ